MTSDEIKEYFSELRLDRSVWEDHELSLSDEERLKLEEIERLALLAAPQWISVKERLPSPGVDVLILAVSGWMEIRSFTPDDGVHAWGWYPGGLPLASSTHWMPLPKPPVVNVIDGGA